MKKHLLVSVTLLILLSTMAFGWIQSNSNEMVITDSIEVVADVNFLYDFGSRFDITITKQELNKVKSMVDIYHEESIVFYKSVTVIIVKNERPTNRRESGDSEVLNESQIAFLRSFEYSTNFQIGGDVVRKNKETGKLEDGFSRPHITVVPEKEVEYKDGKKELLNYLKKGSKDQIAVLKENKLQPGKIFFTINRNGAITNVRSVLTCGYTSIDTLMMELISNAPGQWSSATNAQGKLVEQELVFSYGAMGC